jgi:hypothetical protein
MFRIGELSVRADRAISLAVSVLIVIALIIIVGFGVYLNATFNTTSRTTIVTSNSSGSSIQSTHSTLCYSSTLPGNETITNDGHTAQTLVFKVTTYFDEGDWVSFLGSPIQFADYNFVAYSPNSTSTYFQLEPQLFINVSQSGTKINAQQRASWTDLGGFGGSNWPPDLSPSSTQTLFNGNVTIQFLFPCNTRGVLFEIVVGQNTFSGSSSQNTISLQGFSLCATNCIYPSPYLTGMIAVNGTVQISSVAMYVNGTFNGYALQNPSTRPVGPCNGSANQTCTIKAGGTCVSSAGQTTCSYQYASCYIQSGNTSCTATITEGTNTLTVFGELYKGSLPSSLIPAIVNGTYVITCAATFQDGSQSNATTTVTAY